jgi:hypothetical protein
MSRGNVYRRKADELRRMASAAETASLRSGLLEIADQYEALALRSRSWEVASTASVKITSRMDKHAGATVIGLLSYELG